MVLCNGVRLLKSYLEKNGRDFISLFNPVKPSDKYYVPPALTLSNSTFCLLTVFTCWLSFSQYTAVISLRRINQLVFVKEMGRVLCEVETDI